MPTQTLHPPATGFRVMRVPALCLIRASGADVETFLQGQLSTDMRRLVGSTGQISSYSSPKGRMLAVFYLNRLPDAVMLEVHQGIAGPVLERLRRFVMRSKLVLEDVSARLPALGVSGVEAARALSDAGLTVPDTEDGFALTGENWVSRRRGPVPRFLVRTAPQALDALEARLSAAGTQADAAHWRLEDVEAGIPCVYPETSDHFVAQMANLDLLGGIAFDKGCFTGQEVIARLHYLGSVKRRLALFELDAAGAAPGAPVFDAASPEQPVGEIADVAPLDARRWLASAVLQVAHLASPGLHVGTPDGPRSGPVRPSPPATHGS